MQDWIKKSLFGLVIIISGLYIAILFSPVSANQKIENHPLSIKPVKKIENYGSETDSLNKVFGKNKQLPPGFEHQALLALSAFPELHETKISFVLNEESAALEASVDLTTLFGERSNRHYKILLNTSNEGILAPVKLQNLPFECQVGILAHELGHIAYYEKLNIFEFANWGIRYLLFPSYRAAHEKSTDQVPVWRGLGHQIHSYATFIRYDDSTKELYQQIGVFADLFYLDDKEIADLMEKTGYY